MPGGLLTDLYELTMAASYVRRDMREAATFSLFVRRLPPGRGFLVAAGLEDCLAFLGEFSFDDEDVEYLRRSHGFDDAALRAFRAMRFTGDVWAVPEGRIVFADEPILEVTAPVAEAQVVETVLLNHVTFQTAIASKAARCVIAARDKDVVDFAFRRAHGVEAGIAVARASAIAGFAATSNVEAARRFALRATGTMAHSYVEAFGSEADAFRAFAQDFPERTTFLVDTYDTLAGVRAAVAVIEELGLTERLAVRLDSGDLPTLARDARRVLDDAGLREVRIFASGGLDEHDLDELSGGGVPVDAFGVGTTMGVSADAPSLDSAYKLVQYGERPVLKLSEGKATAPGPKQVFRAESMNDVLALRSEAPPPGAHPLLEPAMRAGRRVGAPQTWVAARERFRVDLAALPSEARAIRDPVPCAARHSEGLAELTARVTRDVSGRA
ncbi:MAG TPA: nicotinate phosphoribosyltransferase [Actinomycetota bacterium]